MFDKAGADKFLASGTDLIIAANHFLVFVKQHCAGAFTYTHGSFKITIYIDQGFKFPVVTVHEGLDIAVVTIASGADDNHAYTLIPEGTTPGFLEIGKIITTFTIR